MIPKKGINQHHPQKVAGGVVAELSREHCNKSSWCCLFPMGSGSILSPAQACAVVSGEYSCGCPAVGAQLWEPSCGCPAVGAQLWEPSCGSPTELLCPDSYWGFII